MALFEYCTLTQNGRKMQGTLEAGSAEQAREILSEMNLNITELVQVRRKEKANVGSDEFIVFNQQLAALTRAGIPLERGLRELAKDAATKGMTKLINAVADDLENGKSLEEAINARSSSFPPLYNCVLKAGIKSGNLSQMLVNLSSNLEMLKRTKRIVFEALAYPAIVLVIAAVIMTYVLVTIVPQFSATLDDMYSNDIRRMPMMTHAFLEMSKHVWEFWGYFVIFGVLAVFLWQMLRLSAWGKRMRERMILTTPILGRIYNASVMSMFSDAMTTLIQAGHELPSSLRLAGGATGSELVVREADIIAEGLESGNNVIESGGICKVISGLFLYSIQLGAQRNDLADNLASMSRMYNEQTVCMQSRLQSILLPAMLLFVGLFIGLGVLAMFLPMVSIVTCLM